MITSKRIGEIFLECIAKEGDNPDEYIHTESVVRSIRDTTFHKGRLNNHQEEICALLAELACDFQMDEHASISFEFAKANRYGEFWTDKNTPVDQLFQLAIAVGKAHYLLPRDKWNLLPGGMPVYVLTQK